MKGKFYHKHERKIVEDRLKILSKMEQTPYVKGQIAMCTEFLGNDNALPDAVMKRNSP